MSALVNLRARARMLTRSRLVWLAAVALVLGGGIWLSSRIGGESVAEREQSGVLLHLKTKVGETALEFTLSDSEGSLHTVTPGGGKPTILVFHMGTA